MDEKNGKDSVLPVDVYVRGKKRETLYIHDPRRHFCAHYNAMSAGAETAVVPSKEEPREQQAKGQGWAITAFATLAAFCLFLMVSNNSQIVGVSPAPTADNNTTANASEDLLENAALNNQKRENRVLKEQLARAVKRIRDLEAKERGNETDTAGLGSP